MTYFDLNKSIFRFFQRLWALSSPPKWGTRAPCSRFFHQFRRSLHLASCQSCDIMRSLQGLFRNQMSSLLREITLVSSVLSLNMLFHPFLFEVTKQWCIYKSSFSSNLIFSLSNVKKNPTFVIIQQKGGCAVNAINMHLAENGSVQHFTKNKVVLQIWRTHC